MNRWTNLLNLGRKTAKKTNRRRVPGRFETLEGREMMTADPLPVLMVIADTQDFYYTEYNDTRISIEAAGLEVAVAATSTNTSVPHPNSGQPWGVDGAVTPDLALAAVDADDYSAIVFVGGWGSSMYQFAFPGDYPNNHYDGDAATKQIVNDLVNDFVEDDKHVAAICHGVTVLAWARVDGASPLDGKQVSIPFIGSPAVVYNGQWYGSQELGQYEQAVANGAIANTVSGQYGDPTTVEDDVIVDGRIITAENYDAALQFGVAVAQEVIAAANEDVEPPVENQAPTADDAVLVVAENAELGTSVGIVAASDPDAGQTLSFAIVGGNASGAFEIDTSSGEITVADASQLDFETTPVFQLLVEATDNGDGPLADTALITIELLDVNESPAAGVFQIGDDLVVQGSDGDDVIYLWSTGSGEVGAWMNGVQFGSFDLGAAGRVIAHGGNGNDRIYATNVHVPVTLFGDAGHDQLTGGTANDLLDGGDGVDRLWGNAGDDLIRGGAGNDFLFGREGNDILLGGEGNDYADGHTGRDLIVGGLGRDYLKAGDGEDLVIAGTTDYDADDAALEAIRATWSGAGAAADRASQLASGIAGGIQLTAGGTVHDEDEYDIICGGASADLIFASLGDYVAEDEDDLLGLLL